MCARCTSGSFPRPDYPHLKTTSSAHRRPHVTLRHCLAYSHPHALLPAFSRLWAVLATADKGETQARIPAPGQSPPYSLSRFLFGCSLNAVMFDGGVLTVLPLDCCCILLSVPAVCLVYGLVSTAHPSLCMPSVLAAAAIAGGICFFAPYVTCY